MKNRFKKGLAQVVGMVLTVVTVVGVMPQAAGTVFAADNKTVTGLGTGAIANPTPGAGGWSYVYYGSYAGNNVKYRVLDNYATEFNANPTMLLDCDSIIAYDFADRDYAWIEELGYSGYTWSGSTICNWLNGSNFYENPGVFSDIERGAIVSSTKTDFSHDASGRPDFLPQNLTGEHVFLLDVKELLRSDYGYPDTFESTSLREKYYNGEEWEWWLRSQVEAGIPGEDDLVTDAPMIEEDGCIVYYRVDNPFGGLSPVFNVDLSSVIFSSLISGTAGASGAEYKLTLMDSGMSVSVTDGCDVTRDGATVTVPYTISGSNAGNATQVSVVIKEGEWNLGTSVSSGYTYLKLDVESFGTSGTGTFTIPEEYEYKEFGTECFIYILAEDVNDGLATDYASAPVSITIPSVSRGNRYNPAPAPSNGGADVSGNDSNGSSSANSTNAGGNNSNGSSSASSTNVADSNSASSSGSNGTSSESAVSGDSSADASSETSKQESYDPDFYDDLRIMIKQAIELGGEQTVHYSKGNKLPYDIMKTLEENPQITVVYKYSYKGTNYKATIAGKNVKTEIGVYWYGPLYLNQYFGEWIM